MSEDDGQPTEQQEWEDLEGREQDIYYEQDPWNVAREEFMKRRMSKKRLEKENKK